MVKRHYKNYSIFFPFVVSISLRIAKDQCNNGFGDVWDNILSIDIVGWLSILMNMMFPY